MKKAIHFLMAFALSAMPMTMAAQSQSLNMPVIQTKYTADPAPVVVGDTVYLYTTHDEDDAEGFKMKDWLLYTSTDMVNWQDRGAVASLKDFGWYKGDNGAWAEQVVERNGKWYMYCPIHGHGIGVLVSDSPYGPFKDPIGKPLVWEGDWDDIDPERRRLQAGRDLIRCVGLKPPLRRHAGNTSRLKGRPVHRHSRHTMHERRVSAVCHKSREGGRRARPLLRVQGHRPAATKPFHARLVEV